MTLAEEYRRQLEWRDWRRVLEALPPLAGQTVLDLGCGVGDLAAELAARGAWVIGIDLNEELLSEARSRQIAGATFLRGDLREPLALGARVDGVWGGFVAAYFVDLPAALERWSAPLRPGGWAALTEIDDLFAHEPVATAIRARFETYVEEALAAGRYDFRMGRKLAAHLEATGFTVVRELALADPELAFDGPARPEVLAAWAARLERMALLRDACGDDFERLRTDFLAGLGRSDHRSRASVRCCIATR